MSVGYPLNNYLNNDRLIIIIINILLGRLSRMEHNIGHFTERLASRVRRVCLNGPVRLVGTKCLDQIGERKKRLSILVVIRADCAEVRNVIGQFAELLFDRDFLLLVAMSLVQGHILRVVLELLAAMLTVRMILVRLGLIVVVMLLLGGCLLAIVLIVVVFVMGR